MRMIHGIHWCNFEEFSPRDSYIESMCAIFLESIWVARLSKLDINFC